MTKASAGKQGVNTYVQLQPWGFSRDRGSRRWEEREPVAVQNFPWTLGAKLLPPSVSDILSSRPMRPSITVAGRWATHRTYTITGEPLPVRTFLSAHCALCQDAHLVWTPHMKVAASSGLVGRLLALPGLEHTVEDEAAVWQDVCAQLPFVI